MKENIRTRGGDEMVKAKERDRRDFKLDFSQIQLKSYNLNLFQSEYDIL